MGRAKAAVIVLDVLSVLVVMGAIYTMLWFLSSSDRAFSACNGNFLWQDEFAVSPTKLAILASGILLGLAGKIAAPLALVTLT